MDQNEERAPLLQNEFEARVQQMNFGRAPENGRR